MWDTPPIIKIYEALGAVTDNRLEIDGNTAKCFSSSGNKFYDVIYEPEQNAIMTNDNGSYWKGYLGYPAIAYLLQTGVLRYQEELASALRDIKWKDINQEFKNDFDKTLTFILEPLDEQTRVNLENYTKSLLTQITELKLGKLGKKMKPPSGY
ncbi:MAG TPA: hypothetical protein PKA42_01580 [Candidatus Paceibacterota bacterium]|nr:hypothetical protein [Candidatus Paceibacterota bacterium]HMO82835.1 hypothetical protein [Candidatus Paceibacterota bacterium]